MKPNREEFAKARRLVGRTIVAAEPRPWDGAGRPEESRAVRDHRAHDWVLTLDDGTRVGFFVEETEVAEYGVDITLSPQDPRKAGPVAIRSCA